MKTPSRFSRIAIPAAAALALCLGAPLRAEEIPGLTAQKKEFTAEERKLLKEADDAFARALDFNRNGKYADAENECRAALSLRQRVLGPEDPDILTSRDGVAFTLHKQGKDAEAEKEYQAVLAIRQRTLEGDHPDVFGSYLYLALCFEAQGKLKEALSFMQQVENGLKKIYGRENLDYKEVQELRIRIEAALKKQEAGKGGKQ